jgi:hypothetical protein
MAPIQPGSAAEKALATEALRAEKHRVIHALEQQKLNPVYSRITSDIDDAQRKLQNMSIETQGANVYDIVKEAQRRKLVEPYRDPDSATANWWVIVLGAILVYFIVKKMSS